MRVKKQLFSFFFLLALVCTSQTNLINFALPFGEFNCKGFEKNGITFAIQKTYHFDKKGKANVTDIYKWTLNKQKKIMMSDRVDKNGKKKRRETFFYVDNYSGDFKDLRDTSAKYISDWKSNFVMDSAKSTGSEMFGQEELKYKFNEAGEVVEIKGTYLGYMIQTTIETQYEWENKKVKVEKWWPDDMNKTWKRDVPINTNEYLYLNDSTIKIIFKKYEFGFEGKEEIIKYLSGYDILIADNHKMTLTRTTYIDDKAKYFVVVEFKK